MTKPTELNPTQLDSITPCGTLRNNTDLTKGRLVTIRVDGLKARIASDLANMVIQRLREQRCAVVVIEEEQ